MYRTHNCGELKAENIGSEVTLAGWVQRNRNLGGMTFIDLRDRYGITQLAFNMETNQELCEKARKMGREFVIKIKGEVAERESKNKNITTGDIEVIVTAIEVINKSKIPPFTIEENTDGGEELRMKYRYLDLRRAGVREKIILRHKISHLVRNYLDKQGFIDVETPVLIKSTPEGARDFIVPSRMNEGQFYALPQSPQVFKQLLMVSGFDKYYQIVKCFRDEDLRADRQPEFTQIDCEMSFVERENVLNTFEGLTKHLFKEIKGIELDKFPRMTYEDAMKYYGSDKPDLRFDMKFVELNEIAKNKGFKVFDEAEYIAGICAKNCAAAYSRKKTDNLTKWVKRPQIGAKGLIYVKCNEDGTFKSSVDKFFNQDELKKWADKMEAEAGDLLLILSGEKKHTQYALGELRLEMAEQLGLKNTNKFVPLWVVDFPLLEWDEESNRFHAMHHPFTSPCKQDLELLDTAPEKISANAYDLVINGAEIGGGSIRIHDEKLQQKMFKLLGFTEEEAKAQFGFLMDAFQYGAPPHGGIAFGFDRLVSLFAEVDSIREVIAFPKNNAGRDIMIDAPSEVNREQLTELNLKKIN